MANSIRWAYLAAPEGQPFWRGRTLLSRCGMNEIDSVRETETKSEWRGEMAVVSIAVELSMMKVPMTFKACRLADLIQHPDSQRITQIHHE